MIRYMDTGQNVAERLETLLLQQKSLINGRRGVQMFPVGTFELELPVGMCRYVSARGVFHYNPDFINEEQIERYSSEGRENAILGLGPYSKDDIACKLTQGEHLVVITEYTPLGIEVRCAVGTESTVSVQKAFFEATKEPENIILIDDPPMRVHHLM